MGDIKFSIIFPTYGVENYIRESITDIINQSYKNWELIIVDDASPDESGRIADEFEKKDERITVIHKNKNGGLSAARNTGLDEADGDYTLFLDPDDRFKGTLLETVHEKILSYNENTDDDLDVVVYSHTEDYYEDEKKVYSTEFMCENRAYYKDEIYPAITELERKTLFGYAWNKAYRTGLLKDNALKFKRIAHIEDVLFNADVFEHISAFASIDRILVHYRNKNRMSTGRLTEKYLPDYFRLQKKRVSRLIKIYTRHRQAFSYDEAEELLSVLAGEYARSFLSMIERKLGAGVSISDIYSECLDERESVLYKKLLPRLRGNSFKRLLYLPLQCGAFRTVIMEAFCIREVKMRCPGMYNRLKQNR